MRPACQQCERSSSYGGRVTSTQRILSTLGEFLGRLVVKKRATVRPNQLDPGAGERPGAQTIEVTPERIRDVAVGYSPNRNGRPDSGEVIWTWVPYEENDGRGKDRPVLVIGRQSRDRVYAVRMTSKPHDRDRDYISIGSGSWDSHHRESWVDIEQLYSVHDQGMRREAAMLDESRYAVIARALVTRYGWHAEN